MKNNTVLVDVKYLLQERNDIVLSAVELLMKKAIEDGVDLTQKNLKLEMNFVVRHVMFGDGY